MFQQKIFVLCKRNLKVNPNLTLIFLALRDEIRHLVNVLISVQHLDSETVGVAQCCQGNTVANRDRGVLAYSYLSRKEDTVVNPYYQRLLMTVAGRKLRTI
jgi:hypothetical protein